MDGEVRLQLLDGQWLRDCETNLLLFWAFDAGPTYDAKAAYTARSEPNVISADDVHTANSAMAARTSPAVWLRAGLLDTPFRELANLPMTADLIEMSDEDWPDIQAALDVLYRKLMSVKGIGAASATKVLHLLRPRLVAIADSLVADRLGCASDSPVVKAVSVAHAIRRIGRSKANTTALDRLQGLLASRRLSDQVLQMSKARIIEALIWCDKDERYQRYHDLQPGLEIRSVRDRVCPDSQTS